MTDDPRSLSANAKMWADLTDISKQIDWPCLMDGRLQVRKLDPESWKNILTAALNKQQMMAQGIDGGWVLLGQRTSKMSKKKMSELLELIKFFGDSKQVRWSAPKSWQEQT